MPILNPYGTKVNFAIHVIKARNGEAILQIQLLNVNTHQPLAQYEPAHLKEGMVMRYNEPVDVILPARVPKVAP